MEEERQRQTSENRKNYQGLPVTTIAIILPIIFLLKKYIEAATNQTMYAIFMNVILLIVGFLFVYDFKIRKPSNRGVLFIVLSAIIIIAGYIILY